MITAQIFLLLATVWLIGSPVNASSVDTVRNVQTRTPLRFLPIFTKEYYLKILLSEALLQLKQKQLPETHDFDLLINRGYFIRLYNI